MRIPRMITTLTVAVMLFAMVAAVPGQFAVAAPPPFVVYQYLLGKGFICNLDPSACPDIARAVTGDTIEITGSGTMTLGPGTVTGTGAFTHKDPSGAVLATGRWVATRLLGFDDYGCGGPGLPDNFCGGQAVVRVHLIAMNGLQSTGTITINCALGDSIPPGATEGVKLFVDKFGIDFNQEVSGFTLFVQIVP